MSKRLKYNNETFHWIEKLTPKKFNLITQKWVTKVIEWQNSFRQMSKLRQLQHFDQPIETNIFGPNDKLYNPLQGSVEVQKSCFKRHESFLSLRVKHRKLLKNQKRCVLNFQHTRNSAVKSQPNRKRCVLNFQEAMCLEAINFPEAMCP